MKSFIPFHFLVSTGLILTLFPLISADKIQIEGEGIFRGRFDPREKSLTWFSEGLFHIAWDTLRISALKFHQDEQRFTAEGDVSISSQEYLLTGNRLQTSIPPDKIEIDENASFNFREITGKSQRIQILLQEEEFTLEDSAKVKTPDIEVEAERILIQGQESVSASGHAFFHLLQIQNMEVKADEGKWDRKTGEIVLTSPHLQWDGGEIHAQKGTFTLAQRKGKFTGDVSGIYGKRSFEAEEAEVIFLPGSTRLHLKGNTKVRLESSDVVAKPS